MLDRIFRRELQRRSSVWDCVLEFEELDIFLKGFFQIALGCYGFNVLGCRNLQAGFRAAELWVK
jgi:hypothetical protein